MAMNAIPTATPLATVSTRGEREPGRFDRFCDAICDVYLGIRPQRLSDRPFDADFAAFEVGGAVVARMSAPGHRARRTPALVATQPDPSLYLNFGEFAASRIDHLGRDWALRPGAPFLIDSESPFDLRFAPDRRFRLTSLRIPKSAFDDASPEAVRRADERIATSDAGRRLRAQTALLAGELDAGRLGSAAAMAGAVAALLRDLLSTDPHASDDRTTRLRRIAIAHLGDPGFGVADLARLAGCSVRTVQLAFAADGESFSSWWLGARLDTARARLADPSWAARSVAAIAASAGFADVSHFHRTYRARFGTPPGAERQR